MIGDGKDGEIYKVAEDKVLKYFFREETHERELEAMKIGQASPIMPRLYEFGDNYIVMEFVKGISLARHMKRQGHIDEDMTKKILFVLGEFKRLGFTRWDTEVRHMLMNEEGEFKVIDHKRAFTSDSPVPTKLLKGMKKFGLTGEFLGHVKTLDPDLHNAWKKLK
ncbi:kinase (plasmid) [Cytobacillus spongiae]|uniref:kinase n=1 Tax=Cytobacillus spongiae TaxID=2901381 RepID=UPI00197C375A|nr:kinase [Cytobacillus spongiae]MCA1062625.1 kinase [Rossellomorea aquimaris]UII58688.1 kinase [Cytobacillus spongiae]WJV31610.1 kinase [Rossellomorea sp. AcN35-11]